MKRSGIAYKYLKLFRNVHIIAKFLKSEFDKNATSGVSAFSITSIYLIQVIMKQNFHISCQSS